jgi:hypothetical protein
MEVLLSENHSRLGEVVRLEQENRATVEHKAGAVIDAQIGGGKALATICRAPGLSSGVTPDFAK